MKKSRISRKHGNGRFSRKKANFTENVTAVKSWIRLVPSDRGGPSRFGTPPNFFDPISSFATTDYWKFEGKCPHCGKMLITYLFVPRKQPK